MMTYLRYWLPVGLLLLIYAVAFGLPELSNKWPHVVIGFMALPLAWSFHYIVKKRFSWQEPLFWLAVFLGLSFISSMVAANPYSAILNWLVIFVGAIIFVLIRTLTPEHRRFLLIGLLIINFIGITWCVLAKRVNFPIAWLPPAGTFPIILGGLGIFSLALIFLTLSSATRKFQKIILIFPVIAFAAPLSLPGFYKSLGNSWQNTQKQIPVMSKILKAYPIFGIGLDNYQYHYPQNTRDTALYAVQSPNVWFEHLISFGPFAFLSFLVFLFLALKNIWHHQPKTDRLIFYGGIFMMAIISAITKTTNFLIFIIDFWILLGLGVQPFATQEVKGANTLSLFRYVLICVGLVFAIQSLSMGWGINRFAKAERSALNGDTKTAVELYAQSLKFDFDPEQRRAYAESLWLQEHNSKNFVDAEKQAKLAIKWNRKDAFARQILARIYFSQQKYAEAEKHYSEALALDPIFSLDAYIALADVYKKQEKPKEEENILAKVFDFYPQNFTQQSMANQTLFQQLSRIKERLENLKEPKE
ncbi:tetratricopeptide repeat protein [Candidatus Parcubacteria bacterium]|jgi:tetratricopeptide (TPR) repeat protein|nr:MAG: tetratricopeptide repeat protein [Candidatus Parcubacteria bacterium]